MTPLRCCSSSSPASAVRLFVQLSCAPRTTTTGVSSSSSPILSVLLPPPPPPAAPRARSYHYGGTGTASRKRDSRSRPGAAAAAAASTSPISPITPTTTTTTRTGRSSSSRNNALSATSSFPSPPPRHQRTALFFSTTAARRQTQVLHNPQVDDDGREMLVEITPRAANRLSRIMAADGNPDLALRIQVESGGCHGFQYLMALTTLPPLPSPSSQPQSIPSSLHPPPPPPPSEDAAAAVTPSTTTTKTTSNAPAAPELREDDTVFAFVRDGDQPQPEQQPREQGLAKVVLDGPSLQLLRGSKVDYTMELIGSQFKIVDNPHATSSCGCGTSFDIKDL